MIAELRIYTLVPGRTDGLVAQFRETSLPLFARHGITSHGPWVRKLDKGEQLVYVLEFEDEEDRRTRWSAFREDPEWKAAAAAGAADGPLIAAGETLQLVRA